MSLPLIQKFNNRNRVRRSIKRQEGVVIIIALFIVALITSLSYVMIARLERDTRRTTLMLHTAQAELYAQGSIAWALDQLHNNVLKQKHDKIIDKMPIQSPINDRFGYLIQSEIKDQQGLFNINNISENNYIPDFLHLLQMLLPDLEIEKRNALVSGIKDWITQSSEETSYTRYYLNLPNPYRPAHRLLQSVSELRLVKGMTPAIFNVLSPYITALPRTTTLNLQTASAPVLASLSSNMTIANGNSLVAFREKTPLLSFDILNAQKDFKDFNISQEKINMRSDFFLVTTTVKIADQNIVLYTLVERTLQASEVGHIVWQSKTIPG